jgi:hypothetical protein
MPNKIADHRCRITYIEERENLRIIKEIAKKNGIAPSAIIRAATHQMCEKLKQYPNTRFVTPIFE